MIFESRRAAMAATLWSNGDYRLEARRFAADEQCPNNPDLPVLIYAGVWTPPADDPMAACIARFESNGWGGCWRNGIYAFPHHHTEAHEVLGICQGFAKVRLGGLGGLVLTLKAGDVAVLPAGTGHENLG